MDEFDKTSFEIELADLLEKYEIGCLMYQELSESYAVMRDGEVIQIGYYLTPKRLRNGS